MTNWSIFEETCPMTGKRVTLTGPRLWVLCTDDQTSHYGPYADTEEGRWSLIAQRNSPACLTSARTVAPAWMTAEGMPAYFVDWTQRMGYQAFKRLVATEQAIWTDCPFAAAVA